MKQKIAPYRHWTANLAPRIRAAVIRRRGMILETYLAYRMPATLIRVLAMILKTYLAPRIRAAVVGGLGMPATPWRRSPRSWAWRGWCSPPCTTAGKRGLTNRHGRHLAALIRHGQIYGFCVYLSETIQKPNIYTNVILPQKNTHVTFL